MALCCSSSFSSLYTPFDDTYEYFGHPDDVLAGAYCGAAVFSGVVVATCFDEYVLLSVVRLQNPSGGQGSSCDERDTASESCLVVFPVNLYFCEFLTGFLRHIISEMISMISGRS